MSKFTKALIICLSLTLLLCACKKDASEGSLEDVSATEKNNTTASEEISEYAPKGLEKMLIDAGIPAESARDAVDEYELLELPAAKNLEPTSSAQYPNDNCFNIETDDEDLLIVFDKNDTLKAIYSSKNDVNYYVDVLSQGDGFQEGPSSDADNAEEGTIEGTTTKITEE